MTSGDREALLVDLDGTLLRGNSFHMWVCHMLSGGLETVGALARWRCRFLLLAYIGMRIARAIDHAGWKYRVQAAWNSALAHSTDSQLELNNFLTVLESRIDSDLLDVVHEAQTRNAIAVMTTAAPAEYADPLATQLGFDAAVTTPGSSEDQWCHNIGEVKCRRTLDLLGERQWLTRRLVLYTDHIDDLALIRESHEVFIVAASPEEANRVCLLIPENQACRTWLRKDGAA